jgi:hypothetical protein
MTVGRLATKVGEFGPTDASTKVMNPLSQLFVNFIANIIALYRHTIQCDEPLMFRISLPPLDAGCRYATTNTKH